MQRTLSNTPLIQAKPFLKWAGGKFQLVEELEKRLPKSIIETGVISNYVEPFIGGGSMFFYLKSRYEIKNSYLSDINPELILCYRVIQKNFKKLVDSLYHLQDCYLSKNKDERKEFYYQIRDLYNQQSIHFDYQKYNPEWIERASFAIFLNKTCYNGLFRFNQKGFFNVPIGTHTDPRLFDEVNLIEVKNALTSVKISCSSYKESTASIKNGSFVYLDPPYRPINSTSHFVEYSKESFTDNDQRELSNFFREMDMKGAYLMLSNSDPKNYDLADNFFESIYTGYNFDRIPAIRKINCNANNRGPILELIITNY